MDLDRSEAMRCDAIDKVCMRRVSCTWRALLDRGSVAEKESSCMYSIRIPVQSDSRPNLLRCQCDTVQGSTREEASPKKYKPEIWRQTEAEGPGGEKKRRDDRDATSEALLLLDYQVSGNSGRGEWGVGDSPCARKTRCVWSETDEKVREERRWQEKKS